MNAAPSHFRIGISGWNYPRWRRTFYPNDLPHRRELEYASHHFNSIEINGTFYSLQSLKSFQRWYDETPPGFLFSIKGPRFITHMKKLKDVEVPLANFFASGILALKEKIGPILWQLPPQLPFDPVRLENFFKLLPRDTVQAAKLARHANSKLKSPHFTQPGRRHPLRYALEVRHPSFVEHVRELTRLLKKYKIALVSADAAADWPSFKTRTTDFAYVRLHGGQLLYASGYSPRELRSWAQLAHRWKGRSRDVFIYFDNDAKVHAPFDAQALQKLIGGKANGRKPHLSS